MSYEKNKYYSLLNNTTLQRHSMGSMLYHVSNILPSINVYALLTSTERILHNCVLGRGSPLSILGNVTLPLFVVAKSEQHVYIQHPDSVKSGSSRGQPV